jgi:hypothetical protein
MKRIFSLLFLLPAFAMAQNVGIGTTTPAAKLDVKSATNPVSQFNGPASMYIGIFENDVYRGYWGSYAGNPEDVDFGTGGSNFTGKLHLTTQASPKLTIDAAGNVGIGTTTPGYLLDVANRARLRQGTTGNIFTTPGIWHTDYRDGSDRIFTGMQDSLRWGIFGGGSGAGYGWGFNFNSRTGNINVGNTTADFYKVQISNSDYSLGLYNAANNFYGNVQSDASGNMVLESVYSSIFGGTPAKHILLNPPSSTIFFAPGNVGVNTNTPNARFHVGGNVYIGTSAGSPAVGYQLSVQGKIISEEIKVQLSGSWPDYVFADEYKLTPLNELEQLIKMNKHLPNIPAAAEVEKDGFLLGDMNKRLLEKVEELTLYVIEIDKENKKLKQEMQEVKSQLPKKD